jgi:uncharacterized protein YndB with AHSA1/START domain
MIRFEVDMPIKRPVEEVFAYLTTASNHPKWDATAIALEPEEAGDWHQGLRFHEVRELNRRRFDATSHIIVFEPNRRMELQSLTKPDFHGTWMFAPSPDGGTQFGYRAEMQFDGFMRLLEPVIGRQFKRQMAANFANLKRILESGAS